MLNNEKDVFNVLFEAVSEGVLVVNDLQKIVSVNSSIEKMFGYNKDELIHEKLEILIPKRYHPNHGSHFKGFMKQKEKRQMGKGRDLYGARKDGTVFPLEIGLNPFEIHEETFVMALVIDVSIRKQQEFEILKLNEELEIKVAERTRELSKTVHELKVVNVELDAENQKRIEAENHIKDALKKEIELNELKTKFLSLVSHEFKTPLSGILTSTMLLGKYKLTEQQEKRDKHLETITNKIHYLNNILNDFLSVEKLDSGQINYKFHTFKLSKVVNEVIYNANMLLKEGQKINYPEDIDEISLTQDEKIIELSLSNLLNNAIKYSPENAVINIEVKQDKTYTTFKVKDNGIGIPEVDQKNIFNRYFRAENALLTQGTGIGLNIIKSHLKNLGGTVTFESTEHIGSIFTMKIINKGKK
ncbi:PAS domain-containing sensor histidine kinase [Polaribacter sp. SA4-10]|uniref:PAS domain-containing sensor histidine kinase n=1 Tax=Polaribacter sp. SA4-10 TaxID=754397 RepID=UPI000B3CC311|nr:HAMP domain-containing sensor histidine kinase [Polaribacter sp. SA4-10]ARV07109.1 PAS domain-containing sensor histidine kinase [Polaribacter sp. SA4-10]